MLYKLKIRIHRHFPALKRRAFKKIWSKSNDDERALMKRLGLTPK